MRFEEIEIFGFGRLKNNLRIPFAKRINVILAPNDKGKSTLQEAIFAILYPFGDAKSEQGRKLRIRFRPWRSEKYGGAITFSLNSGEKFKIEKIISFSPREDKIAVFKSLNGSWQSVKVMRQDKHFGLLTGEYFLGIGREVFEGISMVRQFDVASLGERRKILDEIRAIIEMGKTGEGLVEALKKLQERKNKIGTLEKKGKRTIAGSRQIRLEELNSEIKRISEQLDKGRALLLEKKNTQLILEDRVKKLEKLEPEFENLKREISQGLFFVQEEYQALADVIKDMELKELQNLRNYKDLLAEIKIRSETKKENTKKAIKSIKNNFVLTAIFLFFSFLFLILGIVLDMPQARIVFLAFSGLLLSGSIYFIKVIKAEKRSILQSQRELEVLLMNFSQQSKELGILKNLEENKGIEFYQELWTLFLEELGVQDLEELEMKWHRSKKLSEIMNKARSLGLASERSNQGFKVDVNELDSKIEKFRSLILEKERLEDEIVRLKESINVFDKTIDNYLPSEDLTTLYTERLILEEELKNINRYKQALELTMELLKQAGEELYAEVTPYINEFVNKYFKYLSNEYEFVQVTPDLELFLKSFEYPEPVGIENIGKGMQTTLYLFLRLAIISLFATNKNEPLPFILDETFNVLDDFFQNRQRKFLELLLQVSSDYVIQWIYFTCQKYGQYLPMKNFLEGKGYVIREEVVEDFTILHGGKDESELGG